MSILNPLVEATREIGSPELIRIMERRALEEAERELNHTPDVLEPLSLEGEGRALPGSGHLAALSCVDGALGTAAERLGAVDSEGLGDVEDYWRAGRTISEAGGIVVREHGRRRREPGPAR